jgi:L,D-peptidoglycan transpeptidase YkuD (ErfK/YbiS/YcfS/YnhG family)
MPVPVRRSQIALCVVLLAIAASPVAAQCPAALADATQLVLVRTARMGDLRATLQTFERSSPAVPWRAAASPEPAVVGRSGLGWGWGFRDQAKQGEPNKVEGDGRTPAGIYPLGHAFGFAASSAAGYLRLEKGKTFCVDDVRSARYGQIVARSTVPAGTSGEDMGGIDLYRRGVTVEYPANAAARAGSCIFVHVWRTADKGTTGCVAAAEAAVARLQEWIVPRKAAIAILPSGTPLASCLALPR